MLIGVLLLQSIDYASSENRRTLLWIMTAGPSITACVCVLLAWVHAPREPRLKFLDEPLAPSKL